MKKLSAFFAAALAVILAGQPASAAVVTLNTAKGYFQTGSIPTQAQFGNLIDTMGAGLMPLQTQTAGTQSVAVGQAWNQMDPTISRATLVGIADSLFPNKLGVLNAKPLGTDGSNSTLWAAGDTGYVAGAADVGTIGGGYDHVMNQIAGWIGGGGHNMIAYNASGHGGIGAGSYNYIGPNAARGFIFGGTNNALNGAALFNLALIGSGQDNVASGSFATVLNGFQNNNAAQYSTVINGQAITHTSTGLYSVSFGQSHNVQDGWSLLGGDSGQTLGDRTFTLSARAVEAGQLGDAETVWQNQAGITTDATVDVSLTAGASGGSNITLPAGRKATGTVSGCVTGIRLGGATPGGNGDGNYARGTWCVDNVEFYWDGTNGTYTDGTTTAGPSTSPQFKMTQRTNGLGVLSADFPELRLNLGQVRVAVTGLPSTRIKWVDHLRLTVTHVE